MVKVSASLAPHLPPNSPFSWTTAECVLALLTDSYGTIVLALGLHTKSRRARIVQVHPNELLEVVGEHEFPVEELALSPDGVLLASCSHDDSVKFWNIGYLCFAFSTKEHVLDLTQYVVVIERCWESCPTAGSGLLLLCGVGW